MGFSTNKDNFLGVSRIQQCNTKCQTQILSFCLSPCFLTDQKEFDGFQTVTNKERNPYQDPEG